MDGKLLIDDWKIHAATLRHASLPLKAKTRYDLKLEYYEYTGDALVKLLWTRPGGKNLPPVNKPKVRQVYLPQADWLDFWTGKAEKGGRLVQARAPLEIIPLFVKAGSILPLGPFLEYSDEKPADPLEIRVYPGADGSFTLYEDEGDGYGYEKGLYATIQFTWSDRDRTLAIGQRQGGFPGMLEKRDFNIVVVRPGKGGGIDIEPLPDKSVKYKGQAVSVSFNK